MTFLLLLIGMSIQIQIHVQDIEFLTFITHGVTFGPYMLGQQTFFPIDLSLRTSVMCILLVRTTKLFIPTTSATEIQASKLFSFSFNHVSVE